MTVVVGTAGHIDHGKTSLLRALTGIDADRLPEERRRGMTIDVGYAHLALGDGTELDFVDVPGHDRLVGNMLVGAGEIDAALLVVAADDGPRAQTFEHLELLDALGISEGIAVVTKADVLAPDDPRRALLVDDVARLLARTTLRGVPVLLASSATGEGIDAVRGALARLRDRVVAGTGPAHGLGAPIRLAIDRAFAVRGRGSVVTGTLRGGPLAAGSTVRLVPGDRSLRIREVQVHGARIPAATEGGRVALNVSGVDAGDLGRGGVITVGPGVVGTDRLVVEVRAPAGLTDERRRWPLVHDETLRIHAGTAGAAARVRRARRDAVALDDGREVLRLVLEHPLALAVGDAFVLRRPSPGSTAAGGRVLDTAPPAGISRRRATPDRLRALADAPPGGVVAALVALHGALPADRAAEVAAAEVTAAVLAAAPPIPPGAAPPLPRGAAPPLPSGAAPPVPPGTIPPGAVRVGRWLLASDVASTAAAVATDLVRERHAAGALAAGVPLGELRAAVTRALRRAVTISADDAAPIAASIVEALVVTGRLARDGETVRDPRRAAGLPAPVLAAMDRLELALAVPAPPPFPDAVRAAGCPPEGVRALEAAGRIVRLDPTLAWAGSTFRELERLAVRLASAGPLAPAAYRDATGTSRKYSLAILEELDRRRVLRRTPDGHVLGPKAIPGEQP